MGYVFSAGRISYGGVEIGTITDVSLDQSDSIIPLPGNMKAPVKIASGPGKLTGSFKMSAFDATFLSTITNAVMAPTGAAVALVWYLTDSAGVVKSVTMPSVMLSSIKLSASADKWLSCDVAFEAASVGGTGAVVTVATEAGGVPTLGAVVSKWVFSAGAFTLQTHSVAPMSDLSIDISWTTVPLTSNYRYPIAIANGPVKVTGSAKFAALDSNFIETITNSVMAAPTSDLAAVWTFTDTLSGSHTITLPAVLISGWKLAGGSDKWLQTDVTFEAAAAIVDNNIIEVT
jgi:hypothetical protein